MADEDAQKFQAGQSGLIVRVPEAEPLVGAWRNRLDPPARAGVPAHVTVLFPFLDASLIDEGVCAMIGDVLGRQESFEVGFERCGRFPGVLYLTPEHLTIAQGQNEAVLQKAEADLLNGLPVVAQVSAVDLMVHDGTRWRQQAAFRLA
ncbi:2'-5' RNA ligase family protein [Streptomyces sp. NPDC085596]|uniref:2'-5' RNA ligase family protein n=1 Tax=Streptomyces sp. NPDC085596 TaxID=3365731 RepID=UPI0037D8DBB0